MGNGHFLFYPTSNEITQGKYKLILFLSLNVGVEYFSLDAL